MSARWSRWSWWKVGVVHSFSSSLALTAHNQHTRGLSVVQATVLGGSSPTRVIMAFDWRYYLPKIIIQWSHWARMMGQAAAQCTCVRVAHGSSRAAPRYQHLEMVHTVAHSLTLIEITCSARVWRLRGVVLSVPVDLDWTLFNVRITEPSQRPRRLLTFGVRATSTSTSTSTHRIHQRIGCILVPIHMADGDLQREGLASTLPELPGRWTGADSVRRDSCRATSARCLTNRPSIQPSIHHHTMTVHRYHRSLH